MPPGTTTLTRQPSRSPGAMPPPFPLRGRSQAEPAPPPADPRFDRPAPSPWKRAALLLTIALLFWLALHMKSPKGIFRSSKQQTVVYSNRYSKEYKFRPAASPIITQTMKDGRLEVHGAAPTKNVAAHASPEEKEMKGKGRARTPGGEGGAEAREEVVDVVARPVRFPHRPQSYPASSSLPALPCDPLLGSGSCRPTLRPPTDQCPGDAPLSILALLRMPLPTASAQRPLRPARRFARLFITVFLSARVGLIWTIWSLPRFIHTRLRPRSKAHPSFWKPLKPIQVLPRMHPSPAMYLRQSLLVVIGACVTLTLAAVAAHRKGNDDCPAQSLDPKDEVAQLAADFYAVADGVARLDAGSNLAAFRQEVLGTLHGAHLSATSCMAAFTAAADGTGISISADDCHDLYQSYWGFTGLRYAVMGALWEMVHGVGQLARFKKQIHAALQDVKEDLDEVYQDAIKACPNIKKDMQEDLKQFEATIARLRKMYK
ncbi:Casein kinase I isoform alpha [Mycena kentingensis (nom. inval.)]|nr:Casein kinase I isoform alpha [Mycena kentingensis (nom. inval.)]